MLCDIYCGFGHSSDTYFFTVGGMLGIDRLGYWAKQYGFGAPTGIDLPGEVSGIVPTNKWKQDTLGAPIFPGETYQASIGQGYDTVTPIQLINAYAALANGGKLYQPQIVREIVGPDGEVVRALRAEADPQAQGQEERAQDDAQRRPEHGHSCATPTTSSTCRSRSPASRARPSSGNRDRRGRLPYHSWFVGFDAEGPVPRLVRQDRFGARRPRVRLRLADQGQRRRPRSSKYFLQLHYGIKKDYRNFDLMKRGNFYRTE